LNHYRWLYRAFSDCLRESDFIEQSKFLSTDKPRLRYNSLTVLLSNNLGKIMASATLSSNFQLSIPKAIREELHLRAGQKFAVITKGDIISLVPVPELADMRGIAKGADTSDYRDRSDRTERY
jgi:AbrB family looped-hinge helix DNA binding protein